MNRITLASLLASFALATLPVSASIDGLVRMKGTPIVEEPATDVGGELGELKIIADFNGDGMISVQDVYDFLPAWQARVELGLASVQDLYDFLNFWAAGLDSGKR